MLPTACTARQIKLDVSLIRFAVLNRVAYQFDSNQLFLAVVCVCMCVYAKCYCCHHWFRQTLKQGIMMCAQIVGCTLSDHHWMGLAVPWVTWISVWWSHISRFLGIYVDCDVAVSLDQNCVLLSISACLMILHMTVMAEIFCLWFDDRLLCVGSLSVMMHRKLR